MATALSVVVSCTSALAANQAILGRSLAVKNPHDDPARRKIIIKAREAASDDVVAGDPTVDGATLSVVAHGNDGSSDTYVLPTGTSGSTGKPFWSGDAVRGFRYRDYRGENGPIKSAQIGLSNGVFRIDVSVDGKLGPVRVVPPNPGSDACVRAAAHRRGLVQREVRGRSHQQPRGTRVHGERADRRGVVPHDGRLPRRFEHGRGLADGRRRPMCEYARSACSAEPDGRPVDWDDFGIGGAVVAPGPYIDYEMSAATAVAADTVILAFGTNDARAGETGSPDGESPSEYAANVVTCEQTTARCFVMSMPPHSTIDYQAYNAAVAAVVPADRIIDRTTGMTFVDDGVHLDDPSQRELARRAAAAICAP